MTDDHMHDSASEWPRARWTLFVLACSAALAVTVIHTIG
jgi:hypothetical protein